MSNNQILLEGSSRIDAPKLPETDFRNSTLNGNSPNIDSLRFEISQSTSVIQNPSQQGDPYLTSDQNATFYPAISAINDRNNNIGMRDHINYDMAYRTNLDLQNQNLDRVSIYGSESGEVVGAKANGRLPSTFDGFLVSVKHYETTERGGEESGHEIVASTIAVNKGGSIYKDESGRPAVWERRGNSQTFLTLPDYKLNLSDQELREKINYVVCETIHLVDSANQVLNPYNGNQ